MTADAYDAGGDDEHRRERSATSVIPNGAGQPPACSTWIPFFSTRRKRAIDAGQCRIEPTKDIQRCSRGRRGATAVLPP